MDEGRLLEPGEIADPERFKDAVERMIEGGLVPPGHQREAWSVRAYILRQRNVKDPEALFCHFFAFPISLNKLTGRDERQGGLDMVRARAAPAELPAPEGESKPIMLKPARPLTAAEMDANIERVRNYDPTGDSDRGLSLRDYAAERLGEDVSNLPYSAIWEKLMDDYEGGGQR